jgi:hypothetical protein
MTPVALSNTARVRPHSATIPRPVSRTLTSAGFAALRFSAAAARWAPPRWNFYFAMSFAFWLFSF